MTPLDELFMAETMTAQVEVFADQSEDRSFLKVYEQDTIRPTSNKFTWDEEGYSRGMAPVTGTQSPSRAHRPMGVKTRAGTVYAIKEHVDLPIELIMMARGKGDMPDPEGWLNRNLKNLTNRIQRTRNYWAAQSFLAAGGSVDLALFPNTDIPGTTVLTYPINAVSSSGAWSNVATLLRSAEINPLKRTVKRACGINPGYAIASDVVEGYITQNTEVSNAANQVPTLAERKLVASYLEGGSLLDFGGLTWEFARDMYVTDANEEAAIAADSVETVTDVIADADLVSVLPPESRWGECFAQVEGRVFVPSGQITSAAVGNPFSLIAETRGWAAYLELIKNPVGLRLHVVYHGNLVHKRRFAATRYNTTP